MLAAKNKLLWLLFLANFYCYTNTANYFKSLVNFTHQAYHTCQGYYHYFYHPTPKISKYSINLMWINNQLDHNQKLIFPEQVAPNLKKNTIETILDWAKKNQHSQVNVWFDSKLVTKQAIKNTLDLISLERLKYQSIAIIKLKDVRKLKLVKDHPEVFTAKIPVYFRVDLSRVIVITHTINKKRDLCFVYSDLDILALSRNQIFTYKTLNLLEKYHFVLAKANSNLGFENGFKIFKYDQSLVNGLQEAIIGPCLLSAYEFSKQNDMANNQLKRVYFQETVFRAYPDLFNYLAKTNNLPYIKIPTKKIKMPTSTSKAFELGHEKIGLLQQ